MKCLKCDENSAEVCASLFKQGKVAVIPTDTVYGFSGIVDLKNGCRFGTDARIRGIKGRSETKPMIQLIAAPCDIKKYTDDEIPADLLQKWPGPLTIIVHLKKDSPLCTQDGTVAFRCPGDQWLRKVIELCGAPLYSTSVNRSGSPVLDEVNAICAEFEKEVDLIVDDGDKKGSLPSTIVAIENGTVKVIRAGAIEV